MKIRIYAAAGAFALAAMAFGAYAFQGGSLWEVEVTTTTAGGAPQSSTAYLCLPNGRLSNPPKDLAGGICPNPKFSPQGNGVSWTASCAAGQGQGQVTLGGDGKSLSGEGRMTTPKGEVAIAVTGQVVDTCVL